MTFIKFRSQTPTQLKENCMKIIENQEDHSISIDSESYDRLSKGTDFQRSTNALGMILQITDEITQDMLAGIKMPQKKKEAIRKKSMVDTRKKLLRNPPPNVDADALKAVCG
jgi:hypothetical protein